MNEETNNVSIRDKAFADAVQRLLAKPDRFNGDTLTDDYRFIFEAGFNAATAQRDEVDGLKDENGLLPCPFCKAKAAGYRNGSEHWIECDSCPAQISASSEESTVESWNRRA